MEGEGEKKKKNKKKVNQVTDEIKYPTYSPTPKSCSKKRPINKKKRGKKKIINDSDENKRDKWI